MEWFSQGDIRDIEFLPNPSQNIQFAHEQSVVLIFTNDEQLFNTFAETSSFVKEKRKRSEFSCLFDYDYSDTDRFIAIWDLKRETWLFWIALFDIGGNYDTVYYTCETNVMLLTFYLESEK